MPVTLNMHAHFTLNVFINFLGKRGIIVNYAQRQPMRLVEGFAIRTILKLPIKFFLNFSVVSRITGNNPLVFILNFFCKF
jgi:hypothetical protein